MLTKIWVLEQVGQQEGEVRWGRLGGGGGAGTGWAFQFGEKLGHRVRILKKHTLWPNHRDLAKGHEHKDECLQWLIAAVV